MSLSGAKRLHPMLRLGRNIGQSKSLLPSGAADGPVFVASRRDGFGERLRALMGAMTLAEQYGGDFRLFWDQVRRVHRQQHVILAKERTFSADFIRDYCYEEHAVPRTALAGHLPLHSFFAAPHAGFFRVETTIPENLARRLPAETGRRTFERIAFSGPLEIARRAAVDVDLRGPTSVIHLRAGDVVYGPSRFAGHYIVKVVAFPLALALAKRLRAHGRSVLFFGEDSALCRHAATFCGGVFAGDIAQEKGFDRFQAALFEIALMSRCEEVFAGSSGFALAACQIAGIEARKPDSVLDPDEIRAAFRAAFANPGGTPAISHLQWAAAAWAAVSIYGELFDADERARFLDHATMFDPANSLYKLVRIRDRLAAGDLAGADAALAALARAEASATGRLNVVLKTRRPNGTSAVMKIVENFADLAAADHVGALLCLALAAEDRALAETSAKRFLAIRSDPLRFYDEDVQAALAARAPP